MRGLQLDAVLWDGVGVQSHGGNHGLRLQHPAQDTAAVSPNTLSISEECQFETLVDQSIRDRYDGDLERWEDIRDGGQTYTPIDTDHVRDLLNVLWGELLTSQAIEDAFERLTQDGADIDAWPHGWCQEDEDERSLSNYRTEEDEAAD
jgi:hypothetical protein